MIYLKNRVTAKHDKGRPVNEEMLARLCLRYIGDDGMTAEGTAEAMLFAQRVRDLPPGEELTLHTQLFFTNEDAEA